MKRGIFVAGILLLGIALIAYSRYDDRARDGFTLQRIAPTFADDPKWDIWAPQAAIDEANLRLKQPYFYLAHGFQCYAFLSQDGQYVLKFIRGQRLRPPLIFEWLPNFWIFKEMKEEKVKFGQRRANYLFRSLKVAFEDVPEETGMLLVHLNKTKGLYPTLELVDKAGNRYQVALDDHEFVLQERAEPLKATLSKLMQENQLELAKERLEQVFTLLKTCAKKGIADNDSQLIRKNNLGFLQSRAIYIDTGKITRKESMKTKARFQEDLKRLDPLREWLKINHPQLVDYFDEVKQRTIDSF